MVSVAAALVYCVVEAAQGMLVCDTTCGGLAGQDSAADGACQGALVSQGVVRMAPVDAAKQSESMWLLPLRNCSVIFVPVYSCCQGVSTGCSMLLSMPLLCMSSKMYAVAMLLLLQVMMRKGRRSCQTSRLPSSRPPRVRRQPARRQRVQQQRQQARWMVWARVLWQLPRQLWVWMWTASSHGRRGSRCLTPSWLRPSRWGVKGVVGMRGVVDGAALGCGQIWSAIVCAANADTQHHS